ncbi:hypothetical protein BDP81DRAFT_401241 [Colletotrichum phormii]|uniref:Carrier domain-containing protein n=1 Tax=Colletotrichum phormii TaxID=359342 RepID=A0AAI9ZBC5_9PEZI|nr:uncharacterized protein BDP81DRAFT_401241 [Colletotrichum phormii]KAK1613499.1 hypothetical protein BDP81DRAFT_401241 [Colletotrichum phormii]
MFSSTALFGGNPGQTNYTAANAYLQALGQYRRSKGLAASIIHIGAVMGIGYLTRNSREAEFLTLFAEAVVSGRRVHGVDGVHAKKAIDMSETEIGSGIPALESRHKETIKFYHDPRFGNLKTPESRGDAADAGGSKMGVKEIEESLSDKMRGVLHIPPEESVNAAAPLLDQGIDSLGAITVASWFSKQLLVDIPILRVLSGASIDDLAAEGASRLSLAAITCHQTSRTAFRPSEASAPTPQLHVLPAPTWGLRAVSVASRAEADAALAKLQKEAYDLANGETFKIALSTCSTPALSSPPPAPQYTDFFAVKQRTLLASGGMDASIAYWTCLYKPLPAPLLLLPLPGAKRARGPVSWDQHTALSRLSAVFAFRIKERTKKLRTTPMTFYLAAYAALLSNLSKQAQVSIGLADTNRSSVADLSTMGYFANLLPLRLHASSDSFTATIESAKGAVRQAMAHSVVPHDVIAARLGLDDTVVLPWAMTCAPLFQAVFDYRQGAAESGAVGGARIVEVVASWERTPYDVLVEMSDDPTRDPLVTAKL